MRGFGDWYLYEIPLWLHSGSLLRYWFRNRLKWHLLQSNRHAFWNRLKSLITVDNIIVVTYNSKCHRLSLSLIVVNETPVMVKPYMSSTRHSFTSLTVNTTPVRHEVVKLFTSTHDNIIQTTGIRRVSSDYFCGLKKGKLFPPPRTCLTYSDISNPWLHVTLNFSCFVSPVDSWRQSSVKFHVNWRNWRNFGNFEMTWIFSWITCRNA